MKKSTLIVVILAAALGGAVWYFEFKREKPPEEGATEPKPLFNFKPEEVASISVTRGGETFVIERREKDWHITRPLEAASDSSSIDSLLSRLSFSRISRTIGVSPTASAEKLKEFGLDAPTVTLEIKLKSGAAHRLRLGAKDFSGGYVYALADDAKDAVLVAEDILSSSNKPLLDFRDRRIAIFDRETVLHFRVKNQHVTLVGEKKEDKWLVVEPARLKGKEIETTRILNPLENARATEILDSPTPADRAKLAKPAVAVQLTDKGGKKIEVALASSKEQVLARSSLGPMLFKVAQSIFDTLSFKPEDVIKKEEPRPEAKQEAPKKEEPKKKSRAKDNKQ